MAASPQTQLQIREDCPTEHTDGNASPQMCDLLGLPPELRLLIYEAYFQSSKRCDLIWPDELRWTRQGLGNPEPSNGTALLFVSRQLYQEALLVMHQCLELHITFGVACYQYRRRKAGRPAGSAQAIRLLELAPMVIVTLDIGPDDLVDCVTDLEVVFRAMDHGVMKKELIFTLLSVTTQKTLEPVFPDHKEFQDAMATLKCSRSALKFRRVALNLE
ncbi:hypothetical protein LTR17_011866 [Elasticomyces elasticus]|nr:hypothetical protein LTR17_011866 [Elasticomyces elasticus]